MEATKLKLDYFKFYDVENQATKVEVSLRGQFDRRAVPMMVNVLDFFGNPVSKNGEPIYDKHAHLAWYRGIQRAEPMRRVLGKNQFGKFDIRIASSLGLLVPTQKILRGSVFPEALDHYKVYRVVQFEKAPTVTRKLQDQFGSETVRIGPPIGFAVPVSKMHRKRGTKIQNLTAHLLIYQITPRDFQKRIKVRNQFVKDASVMLVRSLFLAAPSLKLDWKAL
jgi:hypothetical protein